MFRVLSFIVVALAGAVLLLPGMPSGGPIASAVAQNERTFVLPHVLEKRTGADKKDASKGGAKKKDKSGAKSGKRSTVHDFEKN
jgi:hypothetical protein